MIYLAYLMIFLMPITGHMCGGGFGGNKLKALKLGFIPELLFALPFGLTLAVISGEYELIAFVLCTASTFFAMRTGHGVALPWGDSWADKPPEIVKELKTRKQKLSPVVDYLADFLNIRKRARHGLYTKEYCRLFMAVKGFLIGLPIGGLPLLFLWPVSYEIGHENKNNALSETLSSSSAGLVLLSILVAAT